MNDRNDRVVRILLSILFFPIGLILVLAGVRTKVIAWSFAGCYVCLLAMIIAMGIIGSAIDNSPSDPVQAAPDPARAAVPTPVVQECPTPEETLYFEVVQEHLLASGESMGSIGRLSTNAGNDLSLLFNENWKLEVAIALALLITTADAIEAMAPPDSARSIHQDLIQVADHQRKAAVLFAQGVDTFDMNLIIESGSHLDAISVPVASGVQKIESFCQ